MLKALCSTEEVPYCFLRSSIKFEDHMDRKINDLNPIEAKLLGWLQLSNPSDFALFALVLMLMILVGHQFPLVKCDKCKIMT